MFHGQDQHEQPVNEQHVMEAHDKAYNQGNASSMSAGSMGSAAAMQVQSIGSISLNVMSLRM